MSFLPHAIVSRRVLIRPYDAAKEDAEWRAFLQAHDFGQLVLPGSGREVPLIVPAHFAFDGRDTILLHLAKANPAWDAVAERALGVLAVIGAYTFVPSDWNAGEEAPPEWGVPTSYYASVQATCAIETVDDPEALAALLATQMRHFQPEGGHEPVTAGDNPYGRQLSAIRGLRLTIRDVRAKFKFGGNRPLKHRLSVADRLAARDAPFDAEARAHLLRRSGASPQP